MKVGGEVLRVGLIGTGNIAGVHAASIARCPRLMLSLVYSPSRGRCEAFAKRHGARAVDSFEKVIGSADVDVIVIASSTDTHSDFAIDAAKAGKPTYCEKPIDLDVRRAKVTADALKAMNARVMYGFNRRFEPTYRVVKEDVHRQCIGHLQLLQMRSRGNPNPPSPEYIKTSGGIIRDKGVHFFDLARFISDDEPVDVFAIGSSIAHPFIGELGDYDTFAATIRMRSGAICHIDNTRTASFGYDERIEAFGTSGMVESRGVPKAKVMRSQASMVLTDEFPQTNLERVGCSFLHAMDSFAQFATDGSGAVPGIGDALRAQIIAEAVVVSARENRVVAISEIEASLAG